MAARNSEAPFWAGCAEHELRLSRCADCRAYHHFGPDRCRACGSKDLELVTASGRGTIVSFTRVHRAPAPAFTEYAPYMLVLVDLTEGPRMMAWCNGQNGQLRIGQRVRAQFHIGPNNKTLPVFAPED